MSALDKIYAAAVVKTGRPDRIKETKLATVDAIYEYHTLSYFERDVKTGIMTLGARHNGRVDIRELIPNLRKILSVFTVNGPKLPKIEMTDKTHPGYYLVGNSLHIHPSNLTNQVELAYCTKPDAENSWIAEEYPDAIASLAAAKVAAICGNRTLAAALYLEVGSIYPTRTGFKHQIMMENSSYEPDF